MKTVYQLPLFILFWVAVGFIMGEANHQARHAGDYSRGFHDGFNYAAAHPAPPTPETKVVAALLCNYAQLVCVQPKPRR